MSYPSFLSEEAPEPSQPHGDQKVNQVTQAKPPTKGQSDRQTHETSQNADEETSYNTGLLSSSGDPDGHEQRQEHLKPRYQFGADPRSKVINGSLVGSAPSLESQDKCVDRDYAHQDKKTHPNDRNRGAEDAEPPDS
jgi:hypothetical protein